MTFTESQADCLTSADLDRNSMSVSRSYMLGLLQQHCVQCLLSKDSYRHYLNVQPLQCKLYLIMGFKSSWTRVLLAHMPRDTSVLQIQYDSSILTAAVTASL